MRTVDNPLEQGDEQQDHDDDDGDGHERGAAR
jgi:hypothetical protein